MKEEEILIKLAEISEATKYILRHIDGQDQEIKNLHIEDAKKSEEIKDVYYLADKLSSRIEYIEKNCGEHKAQDCQGAKDIKEKIENIDVKFDQLSNKKLVTVVNTVITALVTLFGILGAITGWIKFGG